MIKQRPIRRHWRISHLRLEKWKKETRPIHTVRYTDRRIDMQLKIGPTRNSSGLALMRSLTRSLWSWRTDPTPSWKLRAFPVGGWGRWESAPERRAWLCWSHSPTRASPSMSYSIDVWTDRTFPEPPRWTWKLPLSFFFGSSYVDIVPVSIGNGLIRHA